MYIVGQFFPIEVLTGQMFSLGVPSSWTMRSTCWISELPGSRGLWASSSATMQPTALRRNTHSRSLHPWWWWCYCYRLHRCSLLLHAFHCGHSNLFKKHHVDEREWKVSIIHYDEYFNKCTAEYHLDMTVMCCGAYFGKYNYNFMVLSRSIVILNCGHPPHI